MTSFKYIWIFYAIEYAVVAAVFVLSYITNGSSGKIGTNGLEFNSFIYVGILGILGFKEDFKMLIQMDLPENISFFPHFPCSLLSRESCHWLIQSWETRFTTGFMAITHYLADCTDTGIHTFWAGFGCFSYICLSAVCFTW